MTGPLRSVGDTYAAAPTFTTSDVGEQRDLGVEGLPSSGGAATTNSTKAPTFSDIFGNLVLDASTRSHDAAAKADLLARGATDDLHGTLIAAKEAEISVKLVGSIRNKLIDAFQELWRTNV